MNANQQYDSVTITTLRRVLDDVFNDPRFLNRRSTLALEIAEHLLAQAAIGHENSRRGAI